MLWHESGLLPALPNIEYSEGFVKKTGKPEGSPEYLAAALSVTAVDFYH